MLSGDFAIGLMTIITGLAIADMVASTHILFMNRSRVQWDWLAILVVHSLQVPIIFLLFCYDHLLSSMFSDAPRVAGPRALP